MLFRKMGLLQWYLEQKAWKCLLSDLFVKSKTEDCNWYHTPYAYFLLIQIRWEDNAQHGHVNSIVYYSYFDTLINHYLIRYVCVSTGISVYIYLHGWFKIIILVSVLHFCVRLHFTDRIWRILKRWIESTSRLRASIHEALLCHGRFTLCFCFCCFWLAVVWQMMLWSSISQNDLRSK